MRRPMFYLGRMFTTPVALSVLEEGGESPQSLLTRHRCGDWGEISEDGEIANGQAIAAKEGQVLSEYLVNGERIWVSTLLADEETYTTIMLPEEY